MRVENVVRLMGGAARFSDLAQHFPRTLINDAIAEGKIVRAKRGMYTTSKPDAAAIACQLRGVVSHHTAADVLNMGTVKHEPLLDITVPANRSRVKMSAPKHVRLHFANLSPEDIDENMTMPRRTVVDCARAYSFPRALAIADTAVQQGRVDLADLQKHVAGLRGRGSATARKVVAAIDLRAQSPMESLLRGILIEAGLAQFVPQYEVTVNGEKLATVDLGDPRSRLLLEADSFLWHGTRVALANDARRYNSLVAAGYRVLRFAWEHVVDAPDWVVDVVRGALLQGCSCTTTCD